MHQDAGNTGSSDFPGQLGATLSLKSYSTNMKVFMWGASGVLTVGMTNSTDNHTTISLAAINPETLEVESYWIPDSPNPNDVLNLAYGALDTDTNQIAMNSKLGWIYVVQRNESSKGATLELSRSYSLKDSKILQPGELLLNSMFDAKGNIWFTSGGVRVQEGFPKALGDPPHNSSTIGYIEPSGKTHSYHISNQMIENGIAVSGTNVYVVTGPTGPNEHINSPGTLSSFTLGPSSNVTVIWQIEYSAGSRRKPGAWSRGSGSSVALLGVQYVAITDNDDEQIHLLVYEQYSGALVYSVPVFTPGKGNNDVGLLVNQDAESGTFGILINNNFNATALFTPNSSNTANSADWNDLGGIARQTVRVDVAKNGSSCGIKWDVPVMIPSVPILSTATGLVYGYTQDLDLARDHGLYEFYINAVDWRTGKEVWRVRTGAGGTFNDDFLPGTLGPDGSFFQGVWNGVVRLRDGQC